MRNILHLMRMRILAFIHVASTNNITAEILYLYSDLVGLKTAHMSKCVYYIGRTVCFMASHRC